ncbi:hypothetical protein IJ182_03800 [bacterium]|nr:hypothetical protein [bacterium]
MNKKAIFLLGIIFALLVLILVVFFLNWHFNKHISFAGLSNKKTLIVYYSHSNHTEEIAKMIRQYLNCDITEIKSEEYENKNAAELTNLVTEQIKKNYLPQTNKINISDYNIIFVGSPVWQGNISLPVKSFLINNNFDNKTIIPFYTFGGFVNKSKLDNQVKELSHTDIVLPSFLTVCYKFTFTKTRLIRWLSKITL